MPETTSHPPEAVRRTMAWIDLVLAWLKVHERAVLLGAVVFQILVLASMIAMRVSTLVQGDTILLRVVPVDPRSMFRGEYVTLSYEFSRTPFAAIEGLSPDPSDRNKQNWDERTVYVWLQPETDGVHWHMKKVSIHPPTTGTYLRGTVFGPRRLAFGIESYFVPEGQGHRYEQAMRDHHLSAEIAVTADGKATLHDLRVE